MLDVNRLARLSDDRALACDLLFGHRHPQASPPFHTTMIDLWRCADRFVLFEAFRGAGKTTKAEEHLILEGCFGNYPYGLVIHETYKKACDRLATIDKECRTNVALKAAFGGEVLARKSIEHRVWFRSGGMLEAAGWDQELTGFKYGDYRPTLAYLCDIENRERTRDKTAVDESMTKFWQELVPAMDKMQQKIRYDQTRRAADGMVNRFASDPDWLYFGMPICDGDPEDPATKSNWPDRYSMDDIRKEREMYRRQGKLSEWLLQYMLQAVDPSKKPLKESMLVEWEASPHHWMPRYGLYDPSRTAIEKRTRDKRQSDRYGKVVVSRLGSKIIVHESGGFFWKPDAFVKDVFDTNEKHKPAKIGVEKNSLDEWIMQPLRTEAMRRGVTLPVVALQAPQDRNKEQFLLSALQAAGEAGDIVLIGGRSAHPQLVAEWSNFPSGQLNTLNALAYYSRIFAGVPMYEDFTAANIGEAPSARNGETVYLAFNGSPVEAVCVAVVRQNRRLAVAGDWTFSGSTIDAVSSLDFEIKGTFTGARFESWLPADTYDQWQRIALLPALRSKKFNPMRGEHIAVARGCLSTRIRTQWHGVRELTVDRKALNTLDALSAGYALPVEKGGRTGSEPEPGTSRLIAEALECMVASLDRLSANENTQLPEGANIAYTPGGKAYVSAWARARR